jgi:thiol-disulfide isomerase/thioredoxin
MQINTTRPTTVVRGWAARLAGAIAVSAVALAPHAVAQDMSGKPVLERSAQKMSEVDSLEADVMLEGVGGYAAFMPAGTASIKMARARTEGNNIFDSRVDGEIKSRGDVEEATRVSVHRTNTITTFILYDDEVVQEKAGANAMTPSGSMDNYARLAELGKDVPYKRELEGESIVLEAPQTIGGEQVDVVYVTYGLNDGRQPRGGNLYTHSRWYIAKSDGLPRRVDRISSAGGLSFTLRASYANVRTNTGISPETIAIQAPDGFTMRALTTRENNRPGGPALIEPSKVVHTPQEPPSQPATAGYAMAPEFSMRTVDGTAVTRESVAGQVSVFYFWGTWCVPCRAFGPLISDLAETFEGDPVGVYGAAVRERDADAPREYMDEKGYKHTLLLGSPESGRVGADDAARAFKVRVYPSIALVGAEGELVDFWRPQRGTEPKDLVAEVEQAVRDYLEAHEDKLQG